MFASIGVGQSVWDHPVVRYINGILLFLKNQVGARIATHIPLLWVVFSDTHAMFFN
jgi:hypothetical protein